MKRLCVKIEALIVDMFKSWMGTAVLRLTRGQGPERKSGLFCGYPNTRKASPVEEKWKQEQHSSEPEARGRFNIPVVPETLTNHCFKKGPETNMQCKREARQMLASPLRTHIMEMACATITSSFYVW
ncbi:hypothetical protein HJG60_007979 [Phyllostomus discolor]|uniref:Uncharacterized protein n=1 Tax=Phyllostomus discolor TaxID=89673 RepID=A0A834BJW3_9CHIR|nr:hypothetical protein HJG60_007979 [Phyllostomus discolor]